MRRSLYKYLLSLFVQRSSFTRELLIHLFRFRYLLSFFHFIGGFVSKSPNSDSEPPSNRDRIPSHEREAARYKASHSPRSPAAGSVSVVGQPFDFERPVGVLSSPYCFWKFDIHPENIPL